MFVVPKNKSPKLCAAYRCMSLRPSHDKYCSKHRKRLQRELDPLRYTYNALKSNAKRRRKGFTLTLEEYKEFCERTNYLELRGIHSRSATIDRKDHRRGYSADNI